MNINSENMPLNTPGDLVTGSAPGIFTVLPVGSDRKVLFADSAQTTGLRWDVASGAPVTWTPSVSGSTGAGTANYVRQNGWYVAFGNIVFLSAEISFNSFTGTGSLNVIVPFTISNDLATVDSGSTLFTGVYSAGDNIVATPLGNTNIIAFTCYGSGVGAAAQACVLDAELQFSVVFTI